MLTPFFKSKDENFILFEGDSSELVNKINYEFDMIFADPPYFLSNNGKTIKNRKEIIGKNNVVVLSPEDQIVTKGGPKERRLFFDRLFSIVNSDYLNILQEFNRALKQRNALLNNKQIKEESFFSWEEKFSSSAIKLWEIRKVCFYEYIKSLNKVIVKYQKDLILNVLYMKKSHNKKVFLE